MNRTEKLIGDLRMGAVAAAKTEQLIADLQTSIAKNQRALKSRKKRLWLDADCRQINPAIDGKNDATRGAQHDAICAADPEVIAIRVLLDDGEKLLHVARATLAAQKRDIQVAETELAQIRAELNARAAEMFGALSSAPNGKPAVAATAAS